MTSQDESTHELFESTTLPCGRHLMNRLVKVAMYEHMTSFLGGPPNEAHLSLYRLWTKGNWGMVISGNVQIDASHLTLGRDMVVPLILDDVSVAPYSKLANIMHGLEHAQNGTIAIMQLSHAGRQSANFMGGRRLFESPKAPSPTPLGRSGQEGLLSSLLYRLMFTTPTAMNEKDIDDVVAGFNRGAQLAEEAGFDGVQLHASHGYLLASFLSSKSNQRTDSYSCEEPENALRLVHRIVKSIRSSCQPGFVIGIKLNSADYVSGGHDAEGRALSHLRLLASWCMIDFVEISGGDYEDPDFMASSNPRQAFFARYSAKAMETLAEEAQRLKIRPPLVLLTGGLRTTEAMCGALRRRHADLLGLGRPSILSPLLPRKLVNAPASGNDLEGPGRTIVDEPNLQRSMFSWLPLPKLVGAGAGMAWYVVQMHRLSRGQDVDYRLGPTVAVVRMWLDDGVLLALAALTTSLALGFLALFGA